MAFNFTYPQGTDYPLQITITDESSLPIDLTGYTFAGEAREKYTSVSEEFVFLFTVLNQVTNKGQLIAKIEDTAVPAVLAQPKKVVYDIEMTAPGGDKTRILEGQITITPEVTR